MAHIGELMSAACRRQPLGEAAGSGLRLGGSDARHAATDEADHYDSDSRSQQSEANAFNISGSLLDFGDC